MRGINNITRGVNRLGINAGRPAGLPAALRAKFLFLWSGKYDGDNLKDDLGGAAVITVTGKDFTTRHIPPDTAATFAVPDNATFLAADGADDFWFNSSNTLLQKTHANLIASTTLRTFVKYSDFEPYNVYGIGILKDGETLTDGEKIKLNRFFKLWAEYWGELMDSGYVKSNRIVDDWSSYWATRNAYFALPATGVSLMVGQEVTIYGDTLINVPIGNPLAVTYTCDIGTQVGNNLVINPVTGDIGDHTLRMVFKNGSYTIEDQTITLSIYAEAPAGTKTILMIGDSLMSSGNNYYRNQIEAALDNCTFTFIGTQGTTTKHEGHSGWFWSTAIGATSPFYKGGVLDIAAYFTDNALAEPDYVYIMLGINDTFAQSAPANHPLSDGEISAILNNAKTLIDAFLAYDDGLKVILGVPTLTGIDGTAWALDYGEAYNQDYYIENMHKFWVAYINEFANGTYDARVNCSYEVIHLSRTTGYPQTANGGVHPNSAGYEQLGLAMAARINEILKSDLKPTGLTVDFAVNTDYAKIDFTDATGGVAQHEIWSSKNGGAYILVTTLDAGTVTYNDATWQNASMNYRVRAKDGSWYSDFSAVVNVVTPLVFKTDQTSLDQIQIDALRRTSGTTHIDWGDGSSQDQVSAFNVTHSYGSEGTYFIQLSNSLNSIYDLQILSQTNLFGDLSKWVLPTGLTTMLSLYNCHFTGDVSNWTLPSGLLSLVLTHGAGYGFSGNISGWVIPSSITSIRIGGNTFSSDLSSWILPNTCLEVYVLGQNFVKMPRGAMVGISSSLGIYFNQCNCPTQEIDDFLVYVNNYFSSVTPIKSGKYQLDGVGMGIPSAVGLAAKIGIEAKYTAAGFTATITVNS